MNIYTVIVTDGLEGGTHWVDTICAPDLNLAIIAAAEVCHSEWFGETPFNADSVHVMAIFEGDVKCLHYQEYSV